MQHEHRERPIKRFILEWQVTGIGPLEGDARMICVPGSCKLYVALGQIDAGS
jgi:hypothetical protein